MSGLAGRAALGDFDHDFRAYAPVLADAPFAAVDPAVVRFSPEGTVSERESLGRELFYAFGGDQQDGLLRAAVDFGMRVVVAFESDRCEDSYGNGVFGHAARRDADLKDGTGHLEK